MINTLTTIFVTIATIYILVVGVNLPMPSEHKKFLKNDYFLATLMFFLCYFYTGNVSVTILGIIFYFYFKYYIKTEKKIVPRNFFQMGIFGDLFHEHDEMTDEEYEKVNNKFKEQEEKLIDEINSNIPETTENIDNSSENDKSSNINGDDKNKKLFNYSDLKNEVNEDIKLDNEPSEDIELDNEPSEDIKLDNEPSEDSQNTKNTTNDNDLDNNFSKELDILPNNSFSMDEFEYINKESEHFSDIENVKSDIDMNVNLNEDIIPFEKNNNLLALV